MSKRILISAALAASVATLSACGGGSSGGGNKDNNPDQPSVPDTYSFESQITAGESAVSYTGQTARQMLIEDLVTALQGLQDDPGADATAIENDLDFYIGGNVDNTNYNYSLDGETLIPGPTFGDISTGKNLDGKIAGGNGTGGGETSKLIGNEFFGWGELGVNALPIDLVDLFIERVATEATDGTDPQFAITGGTANIGTVTVDAAGRDYRQLIQKFLLGAVTFSQGTNDYLQTDFADDANHEQDGDAPYTFAEHKWDEAFGYFGAARDYNSYSDEEIAGDAFYKDSNNDGSIDLRSEVNLANSTNCAKRDKGSTSGTDFSKTTFDAFVAGRFILNQAAAEGSLSAEQLDELNGHIDVAAKTWEKCIAATVVHYINDVVDDMETFDDSGVFADQANFLNLAKHWGEMKGFALGLQFSPNSPFRDGSVSGIGLQDLKDLLALMGDAPVLADGSQNGVAPAGTAQEAIDAYIADLLAIRSTLQTAYEFDSADVENW